MENEVKIGSNEHESLHRPAWTSEKSTGMFEAYKHKHLSGKNYDMLRNYYKHYLD